MMLTPDVFQDRPSEISPPRLQLQSKNLRRSTGPACPADGGRNSVAEDEPADGSAVAVRPCSSEGLPHHLVVANSAEESLVRTWKRMPTRINRQPPIPACCEIPASRVERPSRSFVRCG